MKQKMMQSEQRNKIAKVIIIAVMGVTIILGVKGVINLVELNQVSVYGKGSYERPLESIKDQLSYVGLSREDISKGNLVVVNNRYPLRKYDENQLVMLAELMQGAYQLKSRDLQMNEEAAKALNKMLKDFEKEKGNHELIVISAYRNFNEQERIHYETLMKYGQEHTARYVAKPDRSEHHTGLVVDFGLYHADETSDEYDGTGIYSWINDNAYKYGFILRYVEQKKDKTGFSDEPWHFRYVGSIHAKIMKELNLCLEEYMSYLKNYSYDTYLGQGSVDFIGDYAIYYVPAKNDITYVPIPADKSYDVSGNNIDGFVVTVQTHKGQAERH